MKILSYDIESPDGLFQEGNICEFGYVLSEHDFLVTEQDNLLIRPRTPFVKQHHRIKFAYTMSEYNNAPKFCDQAPKIISLLSDSETLVIGHAIHNDVHCLANAFIANNITMPTFKYLDTQVVFSMFKDEKAIMSLDKIATHINIEFIHHRADQDALIALKTLSFVCTQLACTVEELVARYDIELGYASHDEIKNCSTPNFIGSAPSINSKSSKKKLLQSFVDNLTPRILDMNDANSLYKGKKIAITEAYQLVDISLTRNVIQRISDLGAKFTRHYNIADILVSDEVFEDPKLAKKQISTASFLSEIHPIPTQQFDDKALLDDIKAKKNDARKKSQWSF